MRPAADVVRGQSHFVLARHARADETVVRRKRKRGFGLLWSLHRVVGLALGMLILLASTTGGLLVMHQELERAFERDRHVVSVPSAATRRPIAEVLASVASLAPAEYRAFRLIPGVAPNATDKAMFLAPDGRTRWSAYVNPYTAEVVWHGPDQSLLTPWLLALHMHLHLGGWGYLVTGLGGVGLLLLGFSGLIIYRNRFSGILRRPIQLNRGARVAWSDLHKWVGVVSIYFSIVLGLTGTIYAATIAPGQIATSAPLAAEIDLAEVTAIEPLLEHARQRFPGGAIRRVSFPTKPQAPVTILVLHREAPVWRKFSRVEFEPGNGRVRAVFDARAATPREKFSAMLAPLHFGFYGSPITKWLYVVGGFAPALLAASGSAIWWSRRRKARRVVRASPLPPPLSGTMRLK